MEPAITVFDLFAVCKSSPKEELVENLRRWGLIPSEGSFICHRCGNPLRLRPDPYAPEGWRWFCGRMSSVRKQKKATCRVAVSLRKGTFFQGSHLEMWQILGFVHFWVNNMSLSIIAKEMKMSFRTCVHWASYSREILRFAYVLCPEQLGGPGKVVDIDESEFERRKHHLGRHVEGHWVFGAYERGTGKVLLVPVQARDSNALVPIIQQWILPGTTLISDIWTTYDCLASEGYQHLMVNHDMAFKDPVTGGQANSFIEAKWRAAKAKVDSRGRIKAHIGANLARYMFMRRCRDQKLDRTREFFRLAGLLYDPRHSCEEVDNAEPVLPENDEDTDEEGQINFE